MAKYVELDRIMQFPIRRDHYDRENGNGHFINGIETIMEYIQSLPTIDVIMCKDCAHKKKCQWNFYSDDDNGFCAWAEREDECSQ